MGKQHWGTYARAGWTKRGEMNRTESRFSEYLVALNHAGEILDWWYEPITFKLTDPPSERTPQPVPCSEGKKRKGGRYTPDFAALLPDGSFILYEVKGTGIIDDVTVNRGKQAAALYPFRFYLAIEKRKKDGGGFSVTQL